MKQRQKKAALYGFLLVAAGTGLAIDRMYGLSGGGRSVLDPRRALGNLESMGDDASVVLGPPIAAVFEDSPIDAQVKSSADPTVTQVATRDVFSLSPTMVERFQNQPKAAQKAEQTVKKQIEETRELTEGFVKTHRLMGVFAGETDHWIVVNGRILRIGDVLDGFELRHVRDYGASFVKGKVQVELSMPRPLEAKVSGGASR